MKAKTIYIYFIAYKNYLLDHNLLDNSEDITVEDLVWFVNYMNFSIEKC